MGSFERVYNERLRNPQATFSAKNTEKALDRIPAIKLDHLYRMTDATGIVEHAVFVVPNYPEGYSTDDNARALIVAILLEQIGTGAPPGAADLASRYLAFLWLAFDQTTKRFRNCLSYDRQWQESEGSEDSHGRALWGLGTVLGKSKDEGLRGAAGRLFELAVPAAVEFRSPRACAFALLGLHEYLDSFPGDRAALTAAHSLADRLMDSYQKYQTKEWEWFENSLSYSNARLPQALLRSGIRFANAEMEMVGLQALKWLVSIQRSGVNGHFVPIGSEGFYSKKTKRPVSTNSQSKHAQWYLDAWKLTGRQDRAAGVKKRGPHSTGFWAITTFKFPSTTPLPGDAETDCTLTELTKIKERSQRSLS